MSARALTSLAILVAVAFINLQFSPAPPGAPGVWIAAAVVAQALPPLAVWLNRTGFDPARRWISIWAVAYLLSDHAQLALAQLSGTNLWFLTISQPLQDGLLLWALSQWQTRPVIRLTFRIAIPIHVIVALGLAIAANELSSFKTFASTFRSLVILTAAAYTIVSRSADETDRIWMRDWLWTSLGVALYSGVYVIVEPVTGWLLSQGRSNTVLTLYMVKAAFDVLAFLLIWKGMRCPLTIDSLASGLEPRSLS